MTDPTTRAPGAPGVPDEPGEFPDDELLTSTDLYGAEHLLGRGTLRPRESGVKVARPYVYLVPDELLSPALRSRAATAGVRHYEALFAFDLDALGPGRHYTGVRFEVRLPDDARALRVAAGPDALHDAIGPWPGDEAARRKDVDPPIAEGRYRRLFNRLRNTPDDPEPRVFGAQYPSFGFTLTAASGRPLTRRSYALRVLLELPADVPDLAGSLLIGTTISHVRRIRTDLFDASMATAETFSEPLPGPVRSLARPTAGPAAVRLCVATDIEKYSRFTDAAAMRAQQRLVDLLAAARRRAGIDESRVDLQEQGDGQFAILPPDIEETRVVPDLVRALRLELHAVNAELNADAMLRLRVAMCRGTIRRAANGYVGGPAVAVHRMLDAPSVRAALSAEQAAMLVIALSESVYVEVVARGGTELDPADFQPVTARLPEKGFEETAWVLVPPPLAPGREPRELH
ncbi:hypothetical protein AB0K60_08820 [Thermopolyspora sp. NPDC052614]|uniref:hypothetical protein n=1 Tax=Thermopolyspora sp. NPDC052614 TaxID=3155682 RepID=UPI003419A281